MSFLNSMNISGSALTAQKLRMEVIAQNVANSDTTRTEGGGPYKRKLVVLEEKGNLSFGSVLNDIQNSTGNLGVKVRSVIEDGEALKSVYNPAHPDADENGYVSMPNIDTTKEMVEMISASRSYEANVTAFNAVKLMASKALEIGR